MVPFCVAVVVIKQIYLFGLYVEEGARKGKHWIKK